jgi:hypothetical protein
LRLVNRQDNALARLGDPVQQVPKLPLQVRGVMAEGLRPQVSDDASEELHGSGIGVEHKRRAVRALHFLQEPQQYGGFAQTWGRNKRHESPPVLNSVEQG